MDRILLIDLDNDYCKKEKCRRLPNLIKDSLPSREFILKKVKTLQSGPLSPRPSIILFRPDSANLSRELICSIKEKYDQTPTIALVCTKKNGLSASILDILSEFDDIISCPFNELDLAFRIQRILNPRKQPISMSGTKEIKEGLHLEALIGRSRYFLEQIEKIPLFAYSDATLLISGETGTGKELFARAIHYEGPRHGKPFIPINCGALPDHLIENELFGHIKGAFTDAASSEKGLIAEAEGGTLFLDEIDTVSPQAQTRLLRFLQDRRYHPLGSSKGIQADVRIIAATNTDLRTRVEAKLFREDLYHRLNILSLPLPPLRERLEDIPLLASHFLLQHGKLNGRGPIQLSPDSLQKLLSYSWPGNVRELEGVVQRVVIINSSSVLNPEDIHIPSSYPKEILKNGSFCEAKIQIIREFERAYLTNLMIKHQGNITNAALAAGKDRRSLQRLLQKNGLDKSAFKD
ncbi:MAG TPA: sigma-54 dependent transcriptional regulator [Nitrospiria bacterium]|nr:sigma-54 dependent transcriptional regulator [Nitrospiria bacterium]